MESIPMTSGTFPYTCPMAARQGHIEVVEDVRWIDPRRRPGKRSPHTRPWMAPVDAAADSRERRSDRGNLDLPRTEGKSTDMRRIAWG